jgi:hypothetical protein
MNRNVSKNLIHINLGQIPTISGSVFLFLGAYYGY